MTSGARHDRDSTTIQVPSRYPTSVIYVDESGTASNGRFFVVGALKVRGHGQLMRKVRALREQHGFTSEARFNRVGDGNLGFHRDLVDAIAAADTVFFSCVVDRQLFDPSAQWKLRWRAHAEVASTVLAAAMNQRELATAILDLVSTPPDVAMEDEIRRRVVRRLGTASLVTACCHDSKSTDGLQLVDVLTGAVAFERRRLGGGRENPGSAKGQLAEHVKRAFNLDNFDDRRTRRVSILTYRGPRSRSIPRSGSVTHLRAARGA